MPGKRMIGGFLIAVMITAFGLGVMHLLLLRFEAGDVYPAYSTLRSDPLGTQVLFESLHALTGGRAERHFRPLNQIPIAPEKTIAFFGLPANVSHQMLSRDWEKLMAALSENGGRLVFSLTATNDRVSDIKEKPTDCADKKEETPADDKKAARNEAPPSGETAEDASEEKWRGLEAMGIEIRRAAGKTKTVFAVSTPEGASEAVPDRLSWRGALYFVLKDDNWRTLFSVDGNPVFVSRAWGKATLVMLADSYLLSNEAMRADRHPDLLTFLFPLDLGVVFDEFHLGLARQPGIAGLLIKYRLHGVIAAALLISALILWRQAAVFPPAPAASGKKSGALSERMGRDTAEGLIHLMRQHIPPDSLIRLCYENWETSAAVDTVSEDRIRKAKEEISVKVLTAGSHDPVIVYRSICQLLKQGKML